MRAPALVVLVTLVVLVAPGCGDLFKSTVKVEADESLDPAIALAEAWLASLNQPAVVASYTTSVVETFRSAHTPLEGEIVSVSSCSAVAGITVRCLRGRVDMSKAEISIGIVMSGSTATYPLRAIHARVSTSHCQEAIYFPGTLVRIGGGEPDTVLMAHTPEIILDANDPSVRDTLTIVVEVDPEGLPVVQWNPEVRYKFFILRLRVFDEVAQRMISVEGSSYNQSGWIQFSSATP